MSDQNAFGGGNPNSLYVPMTEVEQELVSRLVETGDLRVIIHGWGHFDNPQVIIGDARIGIPLSVTFSAPDVPLPVTSLVLELCTQSGVTLFKKEEVIATKENPVLIGSGITLEMQWDIMVHHMSPELVKRLMPSAIGLTSRRLDRVTGEVTLTGNMKVSDDQKRLLQILQAGEQSVKRKR